MGRNFGKSGHTGLRSDLREVRLLCEWSPRARARPRRPRRTPRWWRAATRPSSQPEMPFIINCQNLEDWRPFPASKISLNTGSLGANGMNFFSTEQHWFFWHAIQLVFLPPLIPEQHCYNYNKGCDYEVLKPFSKTRRLAISGLQNNYTLQKSYGLIWHIFLRFCIWKDPIKTFSA